MSHRVNPSARCSSALAVLYVKCPPCPDDRLDSDQRTLLRKTTMNDRQKSRLLWGTKALLIAALLYVAIGAIWTPSEPAPRLKPKTVSGDERIATETGLSPVPRQTTDYSAIVDSGIFGATEEAPLPVVSSPRPETNKSKPAEPLPLRLVGVIAGGPATSRAIIEDTTTQTTSPYRIGDVVASATIESIESDRIILTHDGRDRVLTLQAGRSQKNTDRLAATSKADSDAPGSVEAVIEPSKPSSRLGYMEDLFRSATIEPYVKNGHTQGLKISGLEQSPLASLVGLRNGDVVQIVNGQNLDSKQKAFQVLKKARTQPRISIQLLRNGKAKDLSFDL